mgnify:CR=1 FL=1
MLSAVALGPTDALVGRSLRLNLPQFTLALQFDSAGALRWQVKLDPAGFDWGNATVGAPAVAHNVIVVPTLYRDLVDQKTGGSE